METETQIGMDDHVHIPINKIGHGGEWILDHNNKLSRLNSRPEVIAAGVD